MRTLCGRTVMAMAMAAALAGCSLSNDRTQIVRVRSVPPDAQVWLDGERVGATPLDLEVRRRNAGPALRIEKDGFAPAERTLPRKISGSGVSDLVFAGVLAAVGFFAGGIDFGYPGAVAASAGYTAAWLAPVLVTGSLYSFPAETEVSLMSAAGAPDSAGAGPTGASSSTASGMEAALMNLRGRLGPGRGPDGARLRDRLRAMRMGSDDDGDATTSSALEGPR